MPAGATPVRTTPVSVVPVAASRARTAFPEPATSGYGARDARAPRFRSALERLAGADAGPSAARLTEALRRDRSAQSDIGSLLERYRANDDASGLRRSLERIAGTSATRDTNALPFVDRASDARANELRARAARRANGASLAYERGPRWRLENPRGEQSRASASTASVVDRRRRASSRLDAHRRETAAANAGGGSVAPGASNGGTSRPVPGDESSLGIVDANHDGIYDDFHHHYHDYHNHYNALCGYGSGWWYSPFSFSFGFSFGYGYHHFKPLWLHHPTFGTYPWYGGYWLGHCGATNWHYGHFGSWSWGFSPYYYEPSYYDAYFDNGPDVIVVESEPEVIVVEQPVFVEQPVANEQPVFVEQGGSAAQVPAVDPASTSSGQRLSIAADRYLTLGDRAFRDERYADAVHSYSQAAELAPDQPVLRLLLADALFAVGDYGSAADALRTAFLTDPLLARSDVDKREFYSTPRAFDRQLAVAELYLFDHPADSDARLVLAVNLLFSGAPASAIDLLEHDLAAGLRDDPVGRLVLDVARERLLGASQAPDAATIEGSSADPAASDG